MPLTQLRAEGHDADHSTIMSIDAQHGNVDVLIGQRVCEPGPSIMWQRLAKQRSCRLVLELDDDLWSIDPENAAAYNFYDAHRLRRLAENIAVADAVTVTTDALAGVVKQWNSNVHVIPNHVSSWLLDWEMPRNPHFTLGWGGSPSHVRDFGELAAPVRSFLNHPKHRDVTEFHCIGPDFTNRVAGNHGRTRHTGWFSRVEPYLQSIDFDVAVIPLRDTAFTRSKSSVKAQEVGALGIPIIASNVGPYADYVRDGETGILVDTPKQWRDALNTLYDDEELRTRLGLAAKTQAAHYLIENNAHRWLEAYR